MQSGWLCCAATAAPLTMSTIWSTMGRRVAAWVAALGTGFTTNTICTARVNTAVSHIGMGTWRLHSTLKRAAVRQRDSACKKTAPRPRSGGCCPLRFAGRPR